MRRFRIVLEYDGCGFHGWQEQEGVRTVEGCLREALSAVSKGTIETCGASRTDTGVHARGQCALAECDTRLEAPELARALAALTPADMGIIECRDAAPDFHPRRSAIEKLYLYRVRLAARDSLFSGRYEWRLPGDLDAEAMNKGAAHLVGEHDFAAFRNRSEGEPENTMRRVRLAGWSVRGEVASFQVIGNGFLYRMVRNFAGTLVDVGRGRMAPARVAEILASRDRREAGPSAPPQGLFLVRVAYPDTAPCEPDSAPWEIPFR
ncbi:MAG: tRNA pseudouridine(38-40) synthase TruA [Planctomycetes bacterium]|nr:tRNA pseudouridine(38-40) synthase TruA [Planctomycetota bacterium]